MECGNVNKYSAFLFVDVSQGTWKCPGSYTVH